MLLFLYTMNFLFKSLYLMEEFIMIKNEYKLQAKVLLSGNWSKSILVTLISFFLIILSLFLVDIIASLFYNNIITGILLFLDVLLILPILYASTITIKNLNTKKDTFHYSDLTRIALNNFKRILKIGGFLFIETLPTLLLFIFFFILFIFGILQNVFLYMLYQAFLPIFLIIVVVGLILTIIFLSLLIKKWILSLISSFIMDDEPDVKTMEVIRKSKLIFKNNKKKFLQLNSSFVLWTLLSIFTLGIGFVFLIPFMKLAFYLLYETIIRDKK